MITREKLLPLVQQNRSVVGFWSKMFQGQNKDWLEQVILLPESVKNQLTSDFPGTEGYFRPYVTMNALYRRREKDLQWLFDCPEDRRQAHPELLTALAPHSLRLQTDPAFGTEGFSLLQQPPAKDFYLAIPQTLFPASVSVPVRRYGKDAVFCGDVFALRDPDEVEAAALCSRMFRAWMMFLGVKGQRLGQDITKFRLYLYKSFPMMVMDKSTLPQVMRAARTLLNCIEETCAPGFDGLAEKNLPELLRKRYIEVNYRVECGYGGPFRSDADRVQALARSFLRMTGRPEEIFL